MNGTVEEWVAKADADFATAGREIKKRLTKTSPAVFHPWQGEPLARQARRGLSAAVARPQGRRDTGFGLAFSQS